MAPFFQLIRCILFGIDRIRPRASLASKKFSSFETSVQSCLNSSLSLSLSIFFSISLSLFPLSSLIHPACYLSTLSLVSSSVELNASERACVQYGRGRRMQHRYEAVSFSHLPQRPTRHLPVSYSLATTERLCSPVKTSHSGMSGTTLGCARDARRLGMFSWARAIPGAATKSCAGFNKTDFEPNPRFFKPVNLTPSNSYSAYYPRYFV